MCISNVYIYIYIYIHMCIYTRNLLGWLRLGRLKIQTNIFK